MDFPSSIGQIVYCAIWALFVVQIIKFLAAAKNFNNFLMSMEPEERYLEMQQMLMFGTTMFAIGFVPPVPPSEDTE